MEESEDAVACDLCGHKVRCPMEEHVDSCHPAFMRWCAYESSCIAHTKAATLEHQQLRILGEHARRSASSCDKGEPMWKYAMDALEQINIIVGKFMNCRVYIFGSCVALGIWDGVGDIDFTIIDENKWEKGEWPGTADEEREKIIALARLLRNAGFAFNDLEPLTKTRVPIVKHHSPFRTLTLNPKSKTLRFTFFGLTNHTRRQLLDISEYQNGRWEGNKLIVEYPSTTSALRQRVSVPITVEKLHCQQDWLSYDDLPELFHIEFDLSCRAFGIRNSFLLRGYMSQSNMARVGSIYLKKWSKSCGINDSLHGYLTSYAVNILWIFYLIQKNVVPFVQPMTIAPIASDATYMKLIPSFGNDSEATQFDVQLGHLIAGFYRYYTCEFDWNSHVVSLGTRATVTKEELQWTSTNENKAARFKNRIWYRFCIADPYEENLNLGRHISPLKFGKIIAEFAAAFRSIAESHPNAILRDRCTGDLHERCIRICRKAMAGFKSISINDFLASAFAVDLESLAAIQQKVTIVELLRDAGLSVDDTTKMVEHINSAKTFVPSEAIPVMNALDAQLSAAGGAAPDKNVGVSLNLDSIFVHDRKYGLLFSCQKALTSFDDHYNFVCQMVHGGSCNMDDIIEEAPIQLGSRFSEKVLRSVLETQFSTSGKVVFSNSARKSSLRNDRPRPGKERCDECGFSGTVWGSKDAHDRGYYCDKCWNIFER